jgi:hypothetical protein
MLRPIKILNTKAIWKNSLSDLITGNANEEILLKEKIEWKMNYS